MDRFGDAQKPIWITETGYGSIVVPTASSSFVDERTQAAAVPLVYQATSAYPQVERVFWWNLRDYHDNAAPTNLAMESHYGLLRASFEPKPAYLAYGRMTGRLDQTLSLSAVTDGSGAARIKVPASFVAQPGEYVAFIALDGAAPAVVVTYQATGGEGSD
jgi:hypothetical protein